MLDFNIQSLPLSCSWLDIFIEMCTYNSAILYVWYFIKAKYDAYYMYKSINMTYPPPLNIIYYLEQFWT